MLSWCWMSLLTPSIVKKDLTKLSGLYNLQLWYWNSFNPVPPRQIELGHVAYAGNGFMSISQSQNSFFPKCNTTVGGQQRRRMRNLLNPEAHAWQLESVPHQLIMCPSMYSPTMSCQCSTDIRMFIWYHTQISKTILISFLSVCDDTHSE